MKIKTDKRINQLYYNKRSKAEWKFGPKDIFNDQYVGQLKQQQNCCYYCNVNQDDISLLIERGIIKSKRFNKRGQNLEIDRKVSLYGAEAVLSFVGLTSSSDVGSICVRSAVLESHMR